MPKPASTSPAAHAERARIMAILDLPSAKTNRAAAEALCFGSDVSPAQAALALARAEDRALTMKMDVLQ